MSKDIANFAEGNDYRLSICIATRNRCALLMETLSSALTQMDERVEIVVVDGASTDDTPLAMARLAEQDGRVHYFREEQNGGIDRDYDKAVMYAKGTYCWLMGDDDWFLPGALNRVLEATASDPSFIVVDAEVRDAEQSRVLVKRRLELTSDRNFGPDELESLFLATAKQLTFIGSAIVRRSLWLARKREPYFGSFFIHVGVVFQQPLPHGALVLVEPCLSIRYGNVSWSAKTFEIWTSKWPNLIWSLTHFPESSRAAIVAKRPYWSARELVMMRSTGAYSWTEYRKWVQPSASSRLKKLMCAAIASAPGGILNLLSIIYVLAFSRARKLGLTDLVGSPHFIFKFLRRSAHKTQARTQAS